MTGSPEARRARTVSASASAAVGIAARRASPVTRLLGASRKSTATSAGRAIRASARSSRLVTESSQGRAVGGAELREDPLVEDDGDHGDEHQVEGNAELDRDRRTAGHLERRKRECVLDEDDA